MRIFRKLFLAFLGHIPLYPGSIKNTSVVDVEPLNIFNTYQQISLRLNQASFIHLQHRPTERDQWFGRKTT